MGRFVLLFALLPFVVPFACGPKKDPQVVETQVASTAPPPPPACKETPYNPAEVVAKEPAVLNACIASAGKIDPNLCGQAKIAVEVGKDGRVTRAEVASSTLPPAVTDCMKARLSAMQFACPKEGSATYTVPVGLPIGGPTGACPGLPPAGTASPSP